MVITIDGMKDLHKEDGMKGLHKEDGMKGLHDINMKVDHYLIFLIDFY